MTPRDEAAITTAMAEARAGMQEIARGDKISNAGRAARDAAFRKMQDEGLTPPQIARRLDIPTSTVRQGLKMAIIRASTQS